MPTVENYGGHISPLSMFSKVWRWDQQILSNFDLGALAHRFCIAEFDKEVLRNKLDYTARYAGLLLVPAEAFFCSLFWPILGNLLVVVLFLQIEEIGLWPQLSSPPC